MAHRNTIVEQFVGGLNTPRKEKVDTLFENLVGLQDLSSSWKWQQNPATKVAKTRLNPIFS